MRFLVYLSVLLSTFLILTNYSLAMSPKTPQSLRELISRGQGIFNHNQHNIEPSTIILTGVHSTHKQTLQAYPIIKDSSFRYMRIKPPCDEVLYLPAVTFHSESLSSIQGHAVIMNTDYKALSTYVPCIILINATIGKLRLHKPKKSEAIEIFQYGGEIASITSFSCNYVLHQYPSPDDLPLLSFRSINSA